MKKSAASPAKAAPRVDFKTALVTGGGGFIGAHLVRALTAQGVLVRVLDNFSSGDPARLDGLGRKADIVTGDIRNALACRNACRGMEVVFHLAALVSVPQSVADPVQSDAVNAGGTLSMLLAARDQGVKRFVFSSSAAVYGETNVVPTPENAVTLPLSPYGVQKLTGEHYARNFHHLYGLQTVSLRYFNVYGPGQNPHGQYAAAVPLFLARLMQGQSPVVFGDGEQTRDFCFVGDVVNANLLAATAPHSDALGNVFNIASGTRLSLNALLAQMQTALGTELPIEYAPARDGDVRHSGADIARARTVFEYTPQIGLAKGLHACRVNSG